MMSKMRTSGIKTATGRNNLSLLLLALQPLIEREEDLFA